MTMTTTIVNPEYKVIPHPDKPYTTFNDFYPFYLGEHRNPVNRLLHMFGTSVGILVNLRVDFALVLYLLSRMSKPPAIVRSLEAWQLSRRQAGAWMLAALLSGYTCSWIGHFFAEKNRPATFKYPVYSLFGDFRMLHEVLTRRRSAL